MSSLGSQMGANNGTKVGYMANHTGPSNSPILFFLWDHSG